VARTGGAPSTAVSRLVYAETGGGGADFARADAGIAAGGNSLATDAVARFRLTTYPSARSYS
jgi:hypothetical protein